MLELYFILYDLRNRRDYETLWDELARQGATRGLESTWILEMAGTSTLALCNHFRRFIDHDDRLLVIKAEHWTGLSLQAWPSNAIAA